MEITNRLRIIRYLASGGIACIANFATLALLVEIFKVHPSIGSWTGFITGAVINYILQYYWTFQSSGDHLIVFSKFALAVTATSFLNTGIFWISYHLFGVWYILSQMIALICVVPINFQINKRFTFR